MAKILISRESNLALAEMISQLLLSKQTKRERAKRFADIKKIVAGFRLTKGRIREVGLSSDGPFTYIFIEDDSSFTPPEVIPNA